MYAYYCCTAPLKYCCIEWGYIKVINLKLVGIGWGVGIGEKSLKAIGGSGGGSSDGVGIDG